MITAWCDEAGSMDRRVSFVRQNISKSASTCSMSSSCCRKAETRERKASKSRYLRGLIVRGTGFKYGERRRERERREREGNREETGR